MTLLWMENEDLRRASLETDKGLPTASLFTVFLHMSPNYILLYNYACSMI